MRGVIYARYSSDNQREESIEGQIRECKVFAERNGIDIIGSYIDRAFSAKTDNRPDFQRIFLYDDKMVITFNYNKGTKTITFAELEASGILSISNIASTGEPRVGLRDGKPVPYNTIVIFFRKEVCI